MIIHDILSKNTINICIIIEVIVYWIDLYSIESFLWGRFWRRCSRLSWWFWWGWRRNLTSWGWGWGFTSRGWRRCFANRLNWRWRSLSSWWGWRWSLTSGCWWRCFSGWGWSFVSCRRSLSCRRFPSCSLLASFSRCFCTFTICRFSSSESRRRSSCRRNSSRSLAGCFDFFWLSKVEFSSFR